MLVTWEVEMRIAERVLVLAEWAALTSAFVGLSLCLAGMPASAGATPSPRAAASAPLKAGPLAGGAVRPAYLTPGP